MKELPKLKLITGEEVTLPKPTMKMWLQVAEYDQIDKDDWTLSHLMKEHAEIIAAMYGLESTDVIDPAEVLTAYVTAASYIIDVATEKLKKLPNAGAEDRE